VNDSTLSRKTASGILWVGIEKWVSRGLTLFVFAILGRLLSPGDFGIVAVTTAIMTIFAVFVEYGFAQSLVQGEKISPDDVWTSFWASLALGVLLYFIALMLTPVFVVLYDEPLLQQIIPVSGLVLIFAGLSSVPAATLERELRFRPLTARYLAGAFVGATVAVVLAMLGFGIWALVLQPVAMAVVATLILWIAARWVPRFRFSLASMRSRWAFSLQVVLIEFLNAMQSNIDKFLIGIFFGPIELGYYFIGQRVLTILMEVVAAVVGKVSLPILSRVQSDHQRFLQYFYTLTFASAGIAFAAFGVAVAFGYPLTAFLFGPGWEDSVLIMALLAPSAMLASVTFFDRSALLAKGKGGVSLGVAAGQFVLGTIVLLAAVPFGILAVAASRSIRQLLYWPVRIVALKRHSGVNPLHYLQRFVAPTIAVIALAVVAVGLQLTPWVDAPQQILSFVLPAVAISLLTYGTVLWALGRRDIREIVTVLRRSKTGAGA
jgi:teichuronic acid exporter